MSETILIQRRYKRLTGVALPLCDQTDRFSLTSNVHHSVSENRPLAQGTQSPNVFQDQWVQKNKPSEVSPSLPAPAPAPAPVHFIKKNIYIFFFLNCQEQYVGPTIALQIPCSGYRTKILPFWLPTSRFIQLLPPTSNVICDMNTSC